MKVPLYIKENLHRAAKLNVQAAACMYTVENWLEKHGVDPDTLRAGDGCGLDEIDYGEDVTLELSRKIERILNCKENTDE